MSSGLFFVPGAQSVTAREATDWVSNPSWPNLTIPNSSTEKVIGLHAVFRGDGVGTGANFVAFTISGDYTVDWGDGSSQNFSSGATAERDFNYQSSALAGTNAPVTLTASTNTVGRVAHGLNNGDKIRLFGITGTTGPIEQNWYYVINATADTFQISSTDNGSAVTFTGDGSAALLPYKIAVITITPQAGQNLTSVNLGVKHSQTNLPTGSSTNWLDLAISIPNATASGLTIGTSAGTVNHELLERAVIVNHGGVTNFSYMFSSCSAMKYPHIVSSVSGVTDMSYMFVNNNSLRTIQPMVGSVGAVTNMSNMFNACSSLVTIPPFPGTIASVTTMANMFQNCYALSSVPQFPGSAAAVTNFSSMFNGCWSLIFFGGFEGNVGAATTMSYMFYQCRNLVSIPPFKGTVGLVQDMSYMFSGCGSLETIPEFPGTVAAVTNMSYMFNGCVVLKEIPPFPGTVAAVTNMSYMFSTCYALRKIPPFPGTVAAVQNMTYMFYFCYSLETIPPFPGSVASVTNMANMFDNCYSLETIPPFPGSVAAVTTMRQMFVYCLSLQSIPAFPGSTGIVTNMSQMFNGCFNLETLPPFPTSLGALQDMSSMFTSCTRLRELPPFPTLTSVTNTSNIFSSQVNLTRATFNGLRGTNLTVSGLRLSATAINELCWSLGDNVTGKWLTLTSNYGVDSAVTKTSICSTTAGSTTVACTNTSGISTGMFVTGSGLGISTDVTVASDVAANTLTKTAHGLTNGTPISFMAIGTTTGITWKTPYYVINSTTDTFQISTTPGGNAIDLTGTNAADMTIRYAAYVVSVVTDTSYTLSLPAASTLSNQTHTFRILDTSPALLKGWSITY